MKTGTIAMKKSTSVEDAKITELSLTRKKYCLDKKLEHSLQLEAAMFELQLEFRNRSRRISQHVGKLGQLLGVERVA